VVRRFGAPAPGRTIFVALPRFALLERVVRRFGAPAPGRTILAALPRFALLALLRYRALLEPILVALPRFALLERVVRGPPRSGRGAPVPLTSPCRGATWGAIP